MRTRLKRLSLLAVAWGPLSCVLVAGCGSGYPNTAPVSGRVTRGGQPVVAGTIMFHPEQGRPAMGLIQPDGSYTLTTFRERDGALPGEHRVTIEARQVVGGTSGARSAEEELTVGLRSSAPTEVKWLVPEEYAREATSPLTATVDSGRNTIDFDLPP